MIANITRNGVEYMIRRDVESGLQFVYADGVKVGQTQSEAGARLIRRNHGRAIDRKIAASGMAPYPFGPRS